MNEDLKHCDFVSGDPRPRNPVNLSALAVSDIADNERTRGKGDIRSIGTSNL